MKAVVIAGIGGAEVFELRDVETPAPRGDHVRVRVRAAGVNRADLMQAMGRYPASPGAPRDIPGLEYAGEVESLGPGVTGPHRIGDRVFGIVAGGSMAEYVVAHERLLAPIPAKLDFDQAAAVPEVFLTALDALETQAELKPGERVLIHAVGGGVGSAAVQLARAMGCVVFGTSRTAEKLALAVELGLDYGINTSVDDFSVVVRDRTSGEGVHALIDHLGGPALAGNLDALSVQGRLVVVGLLAGPRAEIDLTTLLRKRITVVGTTLRARPIEQKIALTRAFIARTLPWLERGVVRPVVDCVFPIEEVRRAQERLSTGVGFGKIVLRI